ncbi:MAG: ribonuclease HII [Candidatus Zophobacter franzmannii]|nr:ribonuclease HII [Candidatus Zophobacter franzmannii]
MNQLYLNEIERFGLEKLIAGADEAGRGPLAGPVVTAAVILDRTFIIEGVNDSKKLSESKRESLFANIIESAISYSIEIVGPAEIDRINILQASLEGMSKSINNLNVTPEYCLIDGNKLPKSLLLPSEAVIKGDGIYACIATASILAKVTRDRIMIELDGKYPQYGFKRNKGYPTKEHLQAIKKYGITKHHRLTFGPCVQQTLSFF